MYTILETSYVIQTQSLQIEFFLIFKILDNNLDNPINVT